VKSPRWLWLAVPAVGLLELVAHGYFANRAPEPEAYRQLEPKVRALRQSGDLVLMTPTWAEPNLRFALGDELMPLSDVARADESGYARAVEVALAGSKSSLADWREQSSERVGAFEVRVLENPAAERVLTNLIDAITPERAQAFTQRGEDRRPCSWNPRARTSNGALAGHPTFPAQRFECEGGEWRFVGVTVIEDQSYRGRRCIWAAPGEKSQTVVRFAGVQLGSRIRGYGGMSYLLERESKGTPINLEVLVDGNSIGTFTHSDGEGWRRFEFATPGLEGQTHDVEFRVSSKRSKQRDFCFQADIR
jgi:hypothetical protein